MRILYVTPLHPINKYNGASRRINKFVDNLLKLGINVHLIYTCQDVEIIDEKQINTISKNIESTLCKVTLLPSSVQIRNNNKLNMLDDFFPDDIIDKFKLILHEQSPDCILINYVFLSKLLNYVPNNIYKVIDLHDKLSRSDIYKSENLDLGFFCTTEQEELKGCERANLIICIQKNETDYFLSSGVREILTIGHLLEKNYLEKKSFELPKKIGFLGSNHVFNAKAIENFIQHDGFKTLQSNFTFVFAGGICDNKKVKKLTGNVELLGKINKESIFYKYVDIVLNPVFLGTGLKIKTIEALSFGKPVIGTKVAFDGINSNSEFHSASELNSIFFYFKKIIDDPGLTIKLSNLSISLYEEYKNLVKDSYLMLVNKIRKYRNISLNKFTIPQKKIHFHHIINPVESKKDSDLYIAQPVTFKSFNMATDLVSNQKPQKIFITHHLVFIDKEKTDVSPLNNYKRYVVKNTINNILKCSTLKPLPRIVDILTAVKNINDEDFLIYTNIDIALTPSFYEFIYNKIKEGHDSLIINRRTISKNYSEPEEYPLMVADLGKQHPGFDCFVFKAGYLKKFELDNTLIGVHLIGRVLLWNCIKFSSNPLILENAHLTFHIGDDNSGKDESNNNLILFNFESAIRVLYKLYDDNFIKRMNALSSDGLKFFYKPNIFRKDIAEKKKPIFIHSMFRTGSSYIWDKLNKHQDLICFYEPFHELLANISRTKIALENDKASKYHTRLNNKNFWFNYLTLLNEKKTGVKYYKQSFAYLNYANPLGQDEEKDTKQYLSFLLNNSKNKRPLLQFNRTALRQHWFVENYPNSINFYLVRNPRSQFCSYYESYLSTNKRGFIRTEFSIIDQNINSSFFIDLKKLIKMPEKKFPKNIPIHKLFEFYDNEIKNYNPRQMYLIFIWHWVQGILSALKAGSIVINTSAMSKKILYRREIELMFLRNLLYVDFDDCSIPSSTSNILSLNEYKIIEHYVFYLYKNEFKRFEMKLLESYLGFVLNCRHKTPYNIFYQFINEHKNINKTIQNLIEIPLSEINIEYLNKTQYKLHENHMEFSGLLKIIIPNPILEIKKYIIFFNMNLKNSDTLFFKIKINNKIMRLFSKKLTPVHIETTNDKILIAIEPQEPSSKYYLNNIYFSIFEVN